MKRRFNFVANENVRLQCETSEAGNEQLTLLLEGTSLLTLRSILSFPIGLDVLLDQIFALSPSSLGHQRVLEPVISNNLNFFRVTLGCLDYNLC